MPKVYLVDLLCINCTKRDFGHDDFSNFEKKQTMKISEKYLLVKSQIPQNVELVAVSKFHSVEKIQEVYDCGQRIFGENKVQELVSKVEALPQDIQWHLIGHLQTNKVKYIASFIDTIQSVDSEKLLNEINRQSEKYNRKIKILLQVKIATEESKYGLEITEAREIFSHYIAGKYPYVEIVGLMGMATFTQNKNQIRSEFSTLKNLFDELSMSKKLEKLSMGMSDDFEMAIACGSNSVRIGSAIFGIRT